MTKRGWSVFWRADKKRYVLSRGGKQTIVPPEFGANRREATAWARAFLVERGELQANGLRRQTKGETFAPLANKWLEFRKKNPEKWAEATVTNNEGHARHHLIPEFGQMEIDRLEPERIASWLRDYRKGRRFNTVSNVFRTLVAFLDWCKARKVISENPARDPIVTAELPDPEDGQDDLDLVIPLDVAQALVADSRVPLFRRVRYALAFTIPARDGELAGLTFGAIDFDAGSISIRQAARVKRSKETAVVGRPKTRRSKRTVPLHSCAHAALRDWARTGWAELIGRAPTAMDPILPGRNATFSRTKVAKHFRADLKSLGAPESVGGVNLVFHHTRGTVLNWLRNAGIDKSIRDYLSGHAAEGVDARFYLRFPLDPLAKAIKTIALEWPGLAGTTCAVSCAAVTTVLAQTGTDAIESEVIPGSIPVPGHLSSVVEQRFRKSRAGASSEQSGTENGEENGEPPLRAIGFGEQDRAKAVTRSHGYTAPTCAGDVYLGDRLRVLWEDADRRGDETLKRLVLQYEAQIEGIRIDRISGEDAMTQSILEALEEGERS